MTWQRIDENTYIDDTLVTCAEYQLFIDEMHEQGKYHQPDHWISYQFPDGHPKEPIFGVRPSDARAFCDWLTKREASTWLFRLPTFYEARNYRLPVTTYSSPFAYWLFDVNKYNQTIPFLERSIPLKIGEFTFYITPKKSLEQYTDLIIKLAKNIGVSLVRDMVTVLAVGLGIALTGAIDLDHDLAFAHAHNWEIGFDRDLSKPLDYAIDRSRALAHSLYQTYYNKDVSIKNILNLNSGVDSSLDFIFAVVLYVNILTLRERITGRSPAFEGIRLVRERIT
jgi:hypothetical protein